MAEDNIYYATGKRKTSTARVFVKKGQGKFLINGKDKKDYFGTASGQLTLEHPFDITDTKKQYDVKVTVAGGGITGQAEAIRHGISKALLLIDVSHRGELKKAGFITRDARKVERKKYGRHKARRSSQFSKR